MNSNGNNGNGISTAKLRVAGENPAPGVILNLPVEPPGPRNGNGRHAYSTTPNAYATQKAAPGPALVSPLAAATALAEDTSSARTSRRFEKSLTIIELAADSVTAFVCVALFLLRSPITPAIARSGMVTLATAAAAAVLIVLMLDRQRVYRPDNSLLRVRETERVLRASAETCVLAVLAVAAFAGRFAVVPHVALLALLTTTAIIVEKHLLYAIVRTLHARGFGVRRVVIFGAGHTGRRIFSALTRSPKLGLEPVAIVDDAPQLAGQRVFERSYRRLRSVPVLPGPITSELLAQQNADLTVIAIPSLAREKFLRVVQETAKAKAHLAFVPSTHLPSDVWIEHADIDGLLVASLGSSEDRAVYEFSKRALDLVLGLALLLLVSPLWLVFWILIRVDSPGPALFVQERVGKDGKKFRLFKFRTMLRDVPAYQHSPTNCTDPRITAIGRILRRTSLDELPQLLNVVRGDMSLVGPRPEMPFIVEQYLPRHRQRLRIKPGLTGLWQISADREFLIHENLEYDLYYIHNRSFFMDLAILLHTAVFAMRGI